MRVPEPVREDAVFGDAVQNAVRTHNGGIHGSGQHQNADQHHEALEDQPQHVWSDKIHGQAADQVVEVLRANRVRNDHEGEEGNAGGENQAVDEDDEAGFFQVGQLGMLDFAIDLRQGFFAAHGQHGVAQADEDADNARRCTAGGCGAASRATGP